MDGRQARKEIKPQYKHTRIIVGSVQGLAPVSTP